MRALLVLFAAVLLASCGATPQTLGAGSGTVPLGAGLERLLIAADDARARAARGDASGLDCCFQGPALVLLRREAAGVQRRGGVDERPLARRLVHSAAGAGGVEAVLEVEAEARPLGAPPALSATRIVRQWWALLRPGGGSWRVEDDHDLPPDRWWRT